MTTLTLGEAAKLTGRAKSTVTRAIKKGRLSAQPRPGGGWIIDASELARAFDVQPPKTVAQPVASHPVSPPGATPSHTPDAVAVAVLTAQLEAAHAALDREREVSADLAQRLDRMEARLALPPPVSTRRNRWWRRILPQEA